MTPSGVSHRCKRTRVYSRHFQSDRSTYRSFAQDTTTDNRATVEKYRPIPSNGNPMPLLTYCYGSPGLRCFRSQGSLPQFLGGFDRSDELTSLPDNCYSALSHPIYDSHCSTLRGSPIQSPIPIQFLALVQDAYCHHTIRGQEILRGA